jgi:hypothetical protein
VQLELPNTDATLKSLLENLFLRAYTLNQPVSPQPVTVQTALEYCKGKWLQRKKTVRKKKVDKTSAPASSTSEMTDFILDLNA